MAVPEMQTANTVADPAQKEPQLPPGPSTQAFPVPVSLPLQAQPSKSAATERHTVIERIDVQAAAHPEGSSTPPNTWCIAFR